MNEQQTMMPDTLKERFALVKDRIAAAARRSGREPGQIMLVAVTKTAEPDQIRELIQLGHQDLAENRVQQLLQRAAIIEEWLARHKTIANVAWSRGQGSGALNAAESMLPPSLTRGGGVPAVRWHMIGHLQRNKVKKVIETCRLIHSVDTLRLAEEIQAIAVRRDTPVDVMLQVNCSCEPQKYGCAIPAAIHLAEQLETMLNVRLRGLMTMAAYSDDPAPARGTFERCRELFEEIRDSGAVSPHFNILSMGMSGDFEAAIEQGSNLVRIGSSIFGPQSPESASREPTDASAGPESDDGHDD